MGGKKMGKFRLISIILIAILLITIGCQATNRPPGNEAAPPNKKISKTERVPQTAPVPERDTDPQKRAERLANLAVRVPQVNDATVIVFGKYAIVGIDVDATLDRSRVGTIKYSVAESLKDDPLGANALVTADPDLVQRLREIYADIKLGHPIKGFTEELSDIVARIIPQAPKAIPEKEDPPTEENQQKLNQTNDPKKSRKNLYQE